MVLPVVAYAYYMYYDMIRLQKLAWYFSTSAYVIFNFMKSEIISFWDVTAFKKMRNGFMQNWQPTAAIAKFMCEFFINALTEMREGSEMF